MSKINFRQILVVFLAQLTLFLGLSFGSGTSHSALAAISNDKIENEDVKELVEDAKYEAAKEKRREAQAARSEYAKEKSEPETIEEKLNLEELKTGDTAANKAPSLQ